MLANEHRENPRVVQQMIPKAPELKIGRSYFLCGYYLRHLPIPAIETWIYIGENLFDEDKAEAQTYHYFERPAVYFAEQMAEERAKYAAQEEPCEDREDEPARKLRIAHSDLEAAVYDYQGLCEWVAALANERNADLAF